MSNVSRLLVGDRLEYAVDDKLTNEELKPLAVRCGLTIMLDDFRSRMKEVNREQEVLDLDTALLLADKEVQGAYAILYLKDEGSVVVGCLVEHIESGIVYLRCVIFESTNHHSCYTVQIDPEAVFEW